MPQLDPEVIQALVTRWFGLSVILGGATAIITNLIKPLIQEWLSEAKFQNLAVNITAFVLAQLLSFGAATVTELVPSTGNIVDTLIIGTFAWAVATGGFEVLSNLYSGFRAPKAPSE